MKQLNPAFHLSFESDFVKLFVKNGSVEFVPFNNLFFNDFFTTF